MVEVAFTPTVADYLAVQRTMFALSLRSRRFWRRMALLVAAVAAALLIVLLALGERLPVALVAAGGGTASGVAGLAVCIGINRLMLPRRARRLFAQQRTLHHEHRTTLDSTGFRQRSVRADIALPWNELAYWHAGRDALLLYSNDLLAYFIPVRAFGAGQLAEVEAMLTQAGLPRR